MEDLKTRLMNSSAFSKYAKRNGHVLKYVLTLEEAKECISKYGSITAISSVKEPVVFFTDDYCFGLGVDEMQAKKFVSGTTAIPITVTPRPSVPDGVVDTIEKYIAVFEKDSRIITSLDELAEYLSN